MVRLEKAERESKRAREVAKRGREARVTFLGSGVSVCVSVCVCHGALPIHLAILSTCRLGQVDERIDG